MGLFSIFKRTGDPAAAAGSDASSDPVQQARTRARRRLIGAVVLLAIGVIGFPLVFETRPRPVPVDIPIEIPRQETAPPLAMPAPRAPTVAVAPPASMPSPSVAAPAVASAPPTRPEVITESRSEGGRDVTPRPAPAEGASSPDKAVVKAPARAPEAAVAEAPKKPASSTITAAAGKPTPSPATATDGARAKALLEAKPAPAAASENGRFVVQVGAFAEAESARETRSKAEKIGLKTYTQVAQTPSGSRIRVRIGPFGSRAEADAALAKARAAGLTAVVLTL